jgi:hypothetical protein
VAVALVGCGEPDEVTTNPHDQLEALEARVAVDCGVYERNYVPEHYEFPQHLCGEAPNIACINDAIAGSAIAKLEYTYLDPASGNLRVHDYYAGDGAVTWIGFFEQTGTGINPGWWHSASCTGIEATPYEVDGMTCYKLLGVGCD